MISPSPNPKDFWTGLIYIFFGSSAILIAREYGMGTAVKMGPAYFPTILGGLLLVIGATAVIRSFIVPGAPVGAFAFKGLMLVVFSVVLFGFVVRGAGLAVALPLLVSRSQTVPSTQAVTNRRPLGLNETCNTAESCWIAGATSFPVAAFQTCTRP